MRTEIREKIKKIMDLYPEEKIRTRKERWRRMWKGKPVLDRYPFLFYPIKVDYYNTVYSKEDRLNLFLDEFIIRGMLEEDFIPAFFPGCRQGTIPSMLGAKEVIKDGDYTCERIIFSSKDIDNLPEANIISGTPAKDWLEMEEYFLEECNGQIPIHVCDMQGPLDVASQLWGYDNVFICAYEDNERYDKLIKRIMQAFVLLWDKQKELCGDKFIGNHMYGWTWIPDKIANASISADSMSMLSPDFFNKFYMPYIRELGQYFDGLVVHSCGDFSAVVKNLTAMPEVKAVNASQMTPQMLISAGWDPNKVIITKANYDSANDIFNYIKEERLRVELCILELWKTGLKGLAIDPEAWTINTQQKILDRNRNILEWVV